MHTFVFPARRCAGALRLARLAWSNAALLAALVVVEIAVLAAPPPAFAAAAPLAAAPSSIALSSTAPSSAVASPAAASAAAASPAVGTSAVSAPAGSAPAASARAGAAGEGARVAVSLQLRSLADHGDHDPAFDASFLLRVAAQGVVVRPQNIVLLNAAPGVALGAAIARRDEQGRSYQLFRVRGGFHAGAQSNANLLRGHRDLDIQIALDGLPAGTVLSADAAPLAAASPQMGAGYVLRTQHFVSPGAPGASWHAGDGIAQQVFVARHTVHASAVSPKDLLSAVLGRGRWWVAALCLGTLWLARAALRAESRRGMRLALNLLAGTVLVYEINRFVLRAGARYLSGDAMESLLDLSHLLWWMMPSLWLHALLATFAWRRIARTSGYPVPGITRTLVPLVGAMFCFTLAMHYVWGYSIEAVWAASGVLSIVLGIALQGLILDAFAGIFLNLERPFKLLQWVNVTEYQGREYEGQVIDVNWRSTRLLTRANNVVSIPNSNLTKAMIANYAEPTPPSRLELTIDLPASVPIGAARRLIKEGMLRAVRDGRLLAHPQPHVAVMGTLTADKTGYRAYFYVDLNLVCGAIATTDAMEAVIERLAAEGIHGRVHPARAGADEFESGPESEIEIGRESGRESRDESEREHEFEHECEPEPGSGSADAAASALHAAPAGLSRRDIALVQDSWAKVVPIADAAAELFYRRLFELDPGLRVLFRADPAMQRRKLMGMLGLMVQGLTRMDRLQATVEELGLRHAGYGVQLRHFDTVGVALLWTLEHGLGEEFTPEVEQAWTRIYAALSAVMAAALNRA